MNGSDFVGFVTLEDTLYDRLQVRDADGQPVTPDAAPTFRVYGPSGLLANAGGVASLGHTGVVTGASNATPIVVTSAAHGLSTGQRVTVASVGGNTAANGTWIITRVSADTFSLNTSVGNGNYTSGGTWGVVGLYVAAMACTGANGYEAGETFFAHYAWAVTTARAEVHGFCVT